MQKYVAVTPAATTATFHSLLWESKNEFKIRNKECLVSDNIAKIKHFELIPSVKTQYILTFLTLYFWKLALSTLALIFFIDVWVFCFAFCNAHSCL